jgi:PAS domain S-box-containing protein
MVDMSGSHETADRHDRWVEMWREAVRTSPVASALLELSTARFIEVSAEAARLFGTTPQEAAGLNYLSIADRPREAAQTIQLVRDGMLDGIRGRRTFRRLDGSVIDVKSWSWAIRSPAGPDLGLWVATLEDTEPAPVVDDVPTSSFIRPSELDGARLSLDDHWRIAQISTTGDAGLGRGPAELVANSIIDLAHPADVTNLLLGFARATTEARTFVRVRLRDKDGSWRRICAVLTIVEGDGTLPFTVVVRADQELGGPDAITGASELAGHLRRIADTIEARGIMAPLAQRAVALGVSPATDLSPRQWEVVARLIRGERVATIAAEMYVSQSTVRNHLTAVYGRFGVHSQAELLAKLLQPSDETDRP